MQDKKQEEDAIYPNVLTFKQNNAELDELHRTFNAIVRTMMLASYSMKDEKEKALLNYSEAYFIEQYEKDDSHKGICLANIGGIMAQKEEYEMAVASFEVSCDMQR